jgi:hypothetical protein
MRTAILWWCISLLLVVGITSHAGEPIANQEPDFVPLFNISGWTIYDGKRGTWAMTDDGTIFTRGGRGGWFMTTKEYADFELRLEYRLTKGANTGIALRSPLEGNPSYAGLEIQLLDDASYKGLKPTWSTGAIWDVVAPSKNASNPAEEWNELGIVAKGSKISVRLNGTQILDANLDDYKDRSIKDSNNQESHTGLQRTKGHIGLQSWDGLVEFRNLRIKSLE